MVLARLLTRAGDHAWGLAIPLALMVAMPGTMLPLAAYYLATRGAVVIAMPLLGRWIDEADRLDVVRAGVLLEVVGVISAAVLFGGLAPRSIQLPCIIASGVVAQIGAAMMAVVLPGRWVPALFRSDDLVRINARLKQCDLVSEVASPVVAGFIMGFASTPASPYRGFHLVALLNLASFALEYAILARVYRANPVLEDRGPRHVDAPAPTTSAFRTFLAQSSLPVMLAYGLLWFTALTPHGALLAGFLKYQWHLSEHQLGLVRGVGALCGLAPTLFYGRLVQRFGLARTASSCVLAQVAALVVACLSLHVHTGLAATAFIVALMTSRIGLYGFVLAEVQIFQEHVPAEVRGRVGAAASSYNNALGLAIYAVALVITDPADFPILAWASCGSVGLAATLVTVWSLR